MYLMGYERKEYKFDEGRKVQGYRLCLAREVPQGEGEGWMITQETFVSDAKLRQHAYTPALGDDLIIGYTKDGKLDHIIVGGVAR